MKKIFAVVLAILMLITANALASSYVGNANSGKFHYASCRWAKKISSYNRVYFNSREEAINQGYYPCKVCDP